MKKFLFPIICFASVLVSCSSDDDNVIEPEGGNPVDVPENYSFERDGASTVSYDGQITRIAMAKELKSAFSNFDALTENRLPNMFSNENNPFDAAELNNSSKSIKSKVAASKDYFNTNTSESAAIKAEFESWMQGQYNDVFANRNTQATAGVAGQIADGSKTRYISGKGLEYNQMYAKSLMGALLADQMLNNYLSPAVLDEGDNRVNNDTDVTEEGKNYTTMEHKWDEAYGYLYGDSSVPTENPMSVLENNDDSFLFHYLAKVAADDDFSSIAQETFDAFKKGRAAIAQNNYEVRDAQANIIKENISLIFAVRAIHYFQGGKEAIANTQMGSAFHQLSEGIGFMYSIRFSKNPATGQPYMSAAELDTYKNELLEGNGFWSVSGEKLDEISQAIADAYGITVNQVD
ncbi:DUF4856 domain-containing protein [Haloflavibacter putidus]|uniref:DUF4856 domain-containing protein n=1 Tax=Haloflavibacter putidus TaxID=2576776 RepID=A0A507ZQ35_9FLAO|nr:DUF4856 domain-containing protein [Haloflavibacter putidus]TQD38623.1 DUF4856 domain-containing protein [Haloflavibacter putidus]